MCKTPEAIYHIQVHPEEVSVVVSLPMELQVSEEEAEELENKIHDAMEEVLAKYFEEK